MKTKEEIEVIAEQEYPIQLNENHYKPDVYDDLNEDNRNAYVVGYTQCQTDMADKRYTEEDLRQAIEKAIYLKGGFDKEGFSFYKDDNEIKDEIINSLNKQD